MPKDLTFKQITSSQRKLVEITIHANALTREVSAVFQFSNVTTFADDTKEVVLAAQVFANAEQVATILTPELYAAVSAFAHGLADAQETPVV